MKEWEKHLEGAEEKLRAANLLLENNMFSDAISEAYYVMFHAANALLALRSIYPKTHAGVVSHFGLQFVTEGLIEELYAKSLAKAETKREKADYDIYFEPSEEEAEAIVEDAEKFLVRIDECGFFTEIMRRDLKDIFEEEVGQANFSISYPGMVRAWHRHLRGQVDCFVVLKGH